MSHRKIRSQGNIPFSWEAKPGVSKVVNKDYPTETEQRPINFSSTELAQPPSPPPEDCGRNRLDQNDIKIPLPPCPLKVPSRSASGKGLKWQAAEEDPFLVAFKVCTRTTSTTSAVYSSSPGNNNKLVAQKNKRGPVGMIVSKLKSKYSMFTCKNACEVKDCNFVKLPPIPRDRIHLSR